MACIHSDVGSRGSLLGIAGAAFGRPELALAGGRSRSDDSDGCVDLERVRYPHVA